MDEVIGVLHIKDLVGKKIDASFDWRKVMRPPKKVPENMPINKLLSHFQGTHQHMAFVVDEYGTIIGVVTLENVVEEIIGNVADEFDTKIQRLCLMVKERSLLKVQLPSMMLRKDWK